MISTSRCAILLGALLLVGCGKSRVEKLEIQVSDLQSQVSTLQAKLDDAQEKAGDAESSMEELKASVASLQSSVGGFNDENWRSVVPDVQDAADDVDQKSTAVESTISDTVSALE